MIPAPPAAPRGARRRSFFFEGLRAVAVEFSDSAVRVQGHRQFREGTAVGLVTEARDPSLELPPAADFAEIARAVISLIPAIEK